MRFLSLLFFTLFLAHASTLYKSIASNPSRLNPLLDTDSASSTITSYLFNGLVKYDKKGKVVGDLAQSFTIENPLLLTFKLRKNVKWHDGKPFTAQDVKFTFDTVMSDKIATPYSNTFRKVDKVVVLDDYTVQVHYKEPYFKMLECWMMGIIPYHILKDEKSFLTAAFNKHPIGTGPYKLKKLQFSKEIVLQAFDDYFEHKPNIDTIVFSIIPDPRTGFYMLKKGVLDLSGLSPIQLEKQIDQTFLHQFDIVEQSEKSYVYMGFNLLRKKFTKKIRQALSYAINKKEMVDILFFKHGKVCHGPFLPGTVAYNNHYEKNLFNQNKAKKLLQEEGYSTLHPFSFELVTNSGNPTRLAAAQIIQYQLKQVGVTMKLRVLEWQAFLNTVVHPRKFDAVLLGWGLSIIPDAYSIWHSSSSKSMGFNFIHYENKKVDRLIEKAEKIVDTQKFGAIYKKIFSLIVEDTPYVFLYIPNSITAVKKSISPIEPSIIGIEHNIIDWIKQ